MKNKIKIQNIEHKWQEIWWGKKENSCSVHEQQQHDSCTTDKNFYCLSMFPYPSGSLHMGHVRNYVLGDVIARHKKLQGYQVLHPIGWDSFGLPAENAAIERGMDPSIWTDNNISFMSNQLKSLSIDHDWKRELRTSDPRYYRWTQWIFKRLFERGLAYQSEAIVNWDPIDKTVLADEQVDDRGRAWRSGALVIKRPLSQWFIRITEYADRLLSDLDKLNDWPESVKQMQRNWIGKQERHEVIIERESNLKAVISEPEHLCSANILLMTSNHDSLHSLKGEGALRNPISGEMLKIIPYHENRLISPLSNQDLELFGEILNQDCNYKHEKKILTGRIFNSNGSWRNHVHTEITFKMRDWLISRQRKWGTLIPIIHCPNCGPQIRAGWEGKDGMGNENEIMKMKNKSSFNHFDHEMQPCPICSCSSRRESDTMDTFIDSSWYYLRFCNKNPLEYDDKIFDEDMIRKWMPINVYIGGIEHAILHLLYARFIGKVLADEFPHLSDYLSEPFSKLICQGMVEGLSRKTLDGRYLKSEEIDDNAIIEWSKMSKSKYNGIDPQSIIDKYGIDSLRIYIMFKAPPQIPFKWEESEIIGSFRWITRLLSFLDYYESLLVLNTDKMEKDIQENMNQNREDFPLDLISAYNDCLLKVNQAYDPSNYNINTALAAMMKFFNTLSSFTPFDIKYGSLLNKLSVMLMPVAPHIGSEIYSKTINQNERMKELDFQSIKWPDYIPISSNKKLFVYQLNGKFIKNLDREVDLTRSSFPPFPSQFDPNQHQLKRIELPDKIILNLIDR